MRGIRAKARRQPIYGRVSALVDPGTGESIGCLVPANAQEREALRVRKLKIGTIVRMEIFSVRHFKHHRLAMKVLQIVVDNSDTLHNVDQLLTILKIKMGYVETIIDDTGRTFYLPMSIAFDQMSQDEFEKFYRGMLVVIRRDFFPGMSEAEIERISDMTKDQFHD